MRQTAQVTLALDLESRTLNPVRSSTETVIKTSKTPNLYRLSPNLTPRPDLPKQFETRNFPLTSRSFGESTSVDKDNSRDSKSPTISSTVDLDVSHSEEFGKRILKATIERKNLEEQCKLMENRIKKLSLEDQKTKTKTKQTQDKTQTIIKNRERHLNDLAFIEKYKKDMEKSIQEKQAQVMKTKHISDEKKKEMYKKTFDSKLSVAQQVKQEKAANMTLKEELKREEDIKKNEKIWKIALHEKKLENSKLYNKIKTHNEARKVYETRLATEETRCNEMVNKIKDMERLETQLLEKLRMTHNSHMNAYAEMQKAYELSPPTRNMSPVSGTSTNTSISLNKKKK